MSHPLPPSPHGHSRDLLRDPLNFFLTLTRQYGDVVCYRPAPEPAYLVNHPDDIRHVLVDNNRNYIKATYINQMFKTAVGDGLLTSEGETWRSQRRMMQPSFHKHNLARMDSLVIDQTERMLSKWEAAVRQNRPVNLAQEIASLTLGITTRALFKVDLDEEIDRVGQAVDMGGALLERPNHPRFKAGIQMIKETVESIIASRRGSNNGEGPIGDLLGTMMQARDEETGQGMDDLALRNQVITLLLAGYETTASALTWTFYLLSQHPEVVARLRAELRDVLDGRTPVSDDLPSLDYTRMIFEEALRLYPPAWVLGRVALGEDRLGGYAVPPRTIIAISPYTVHRHLAFWRDPDHFDPERFSHQRSSQRQRFSYIPFGAGPRQCIGNTFAMLEAQLIIAMVMGRFDLALVPGQEIQPEVVFVLRPDKSMQVVLSDVP